jgi:hypothetical protein
MTTAHIDAEEIDVTRSEKLLAFVLAGFLLVGGLWVYFSPLDRVHAGNQDYPVARVSAADRAAVNRSAVVAGCATCGEPRRVGTPHCAACGAT